VSAAAESCLPCFPSQDPSISRLRSHIRHPSTSSINSTSSSQAGRSSQNPPPAPPSSHFSQLSRTTSSSTLHSLNSSSHLSTKQSQPASTPSSADPIHYTTLKRISHFLYPSRSSAKLASLGAMAGAEGRKLKRGELGVPTVMSAEGMICVGTDKGWVGVWDFKGEMRGWYGNESICTSALSLPCSGCQRKTLSVLTCSRCVPFTTSFNSRVRHSPHPLTRPHLHRRRSRFRPHPPL
jgi:hypothetical protein